MSFVTIKAWLAGLCVVALAGCGGGGGASGDAALGGGSGSGAGASATVTLSLSSPTVTPAAPATVTVTVRDAAGIPMAGTVVDLSMERKTFANLSVTSVATDAKGSATATLTAGSGGLSGSDTVVGVAKLGTTTVQGSVAFTVTGSQPTVSLSIDSATLRGSTGATTLRAVVLDAAGNPVPNVLVAFAAAGKRILLGAPSAKTDAAGKASVTAAVVDPAVTAADTLSADATVASIAVRSTLVVQLVADAPSITLSANRANVSASLPATLSIQVMDASGKPVGKGTVITLSSAFGLSAFDASTAVTDAAGQAQVQVSPKTAGSNGADQIVASATVGGVTISAQTVLQIASSATASVTVSIAPSTISTTVPAIVTVIVRDSKGAAVPGVVVDLSTVRKGLATLGVASVATDANGVATTSLVAASGALGGADQVVGVATLGATTAQGSSSFTVSGTSATLALSASSTSLRGSTGGATLTALVKDAAGNPVSGTQVAFRAAAGRVALGAPTAVTNALGLASVTAAVADPSVTAAETVIASASVGSVVVQASLVMQVLADAPTLTLSASNFNVTASAPSVLSILVKNAAGTPVGANTVVSVSSTYGLTSFDASTAVTDATGVARVVVTPSTVTSNGADLLVATATIGGVSVTQQIVLQVSSSSTSIKLVTLALSSATVTTASPVTVTVRVRDAIGNAVPGAVVDLSTVRGNLALLSVASVSTDAAGNATASLQAIAGGISGADQVVAQIKGGAATTQGTASFTVAGSAPTVNLSVSPVSATLSGAAATATLTATVRDVSGNVAGNQQVSFASIGGRLSLSATSAKTDSNGQASTVVRVVDPSVTTADAVTASVTVGASVAQSTLVFQLNADTPQMTIAPAAGFTSTVSATVPTKLSIRVTTAAGANVADGTIVSFSSAYGLSAFDATTASTTSGVAQVTVTPKTATSNGADQIVATAVVGGVTVTRQTTVQVSSANSSASPVLQTALSSTSISAASPATVTATLTDGNGTAVAGSVVTFNVVRGLGKTSVGTALTDANGKAVVVLSPVNSTTAGADEVTATANFAGTALSSTKGFQIQAANVTLSKFESLVPSLGAYGQTTLRVTIVGASVGSPVNISVTSSCVVLGKATLSPSTFTTTTTTFDLQYKDNGCGALQTADQLQATITGSSAAPLPLPLPIASPTAASVAFIGAAPEVIYIKGSGFTESSTLTFEVRDGAGNVLPNRSVVLSLLTQSGGLTIEGGIADVTQRSDANGRVTVRVNSGTIPTPIRVSATLVKLLNTEPTIATVSSNLSVAVGLPSQLNFSLSQATRNIEGFNTDGVPNTYTVIASDRNGNPVANGTSVNFVTEGGQIQSVVQIQGLNPSVGNPAGTITSATAKFQSSSPRPADGRVTVTAYMLGEESFIDQNGNNVYDLGEPFQDLGNVFKDRIFDGAFDVSVDEYIPTNIANAGACLTPALSGPAFNGTVGVTATTSALLALDASIPSAPSTCDSAWSGAGKVYVRRAAETVFSTSVARVLWTSKAGLDTSCRSLTLQTGPLPATNSVFTPVQSGETWYGSGPATLTLPFIVADANTFPAPGPGGTVGRLNPMAAGTVVSATGTTGLKVLVTGTPVPSTTEATPAGVGVTFETATTGTVFVTFTSPSGVGTSYAINVQQTSAGKVGSCP